MKFPPQTMRSERKGRNEGNMREMRSSPSKIGWGEKRERNIGNIYGWIILMVSFYHSTNQFMVNVQFIIIIIISWVEFRIIQRKETETGRFSW